MGTCALHLVAVPTKPWVFCYIPLWCLNPGLQWQGDKAAAEASLVSLHAVGLIAFKPLAAGGQGSQHTS